MKKYIVITLTVGILVGIIIKLRRKIDLLEKRLKVLDVEDDIEAWDNEIAEYIDKKFNQENEK